MQSRGRQAEGRMIEGFGSNRFSFNTTHMIQSILKQDDREFWLKQVSKTSYDPSEFLLFVGSLCPCSQ